MIIRALEKVISWGWRLGVVVAIQAVLASSAAASVVPDVSVVPTPANPPVNASEQVGEATSANPGPSPVNSQVQTVNGEVQAIADQIQAATARSQANSQDPSPGTPEPVTHPDSDHPGSGIEQRFGPSSNVPPILGPYQQGFDVSSYQGNVNWNQAHATGAQWAYIKATEATGYTNPYFGQQSSGAASAGLVRGAYHFAIPSNSSGASQADYFVAHGGAWKADNHTLPGALDIEYNPYGANECYGLSQGQMVGWISSFVNEYHAVTSRWPTIYSTTDWWKTCTGNYGGFGSNDPLWIANWSVSPDPLPNGWSNYAFWQYANQGPYPGDQDRFNGTYAQLVGLANNTP